MPALICSLFPGRGPAHLQPAHEHSTGGLPGGWCALYTAGRATPAWPALV